MTDYKGKTKGIKYMTYKTYYIQKYKDDIENFNKLTEESKWAWILGILETDGSLGITYKMGTMTSKTKKIPFTVYPSFSITQKGRNELICVLIMYYFCELQNFQEPRLEETTMYTKSKKNEDIVRFEARWQSQRKMEDFLKWLTETSQKYNMNFIATKFFDELLIRAIMKLNQESKKYSYIKDLEEKNKKTNIIKRQILDLKFCMHQPNKETWVDIVSFAKNRKDWSVWEDDLDLTKNSSIDAAKEIIEKIEETYHANVMSYLQNEKKVHPYYMTGLMEGDGSITISINIKTPPSIRPFTLNTQLILAGTEDSRALFVLTSKYFNLKSVIAKKKQSKEEQLRSYLDANLTSWKYIKNHFENYPYILSVKQERFNILNDMYKIGWFSRSTDFIPSYKFSKEIIIRIYNLKGQGFEWKESLDSVLYWLKIYYNKMKEL